MSFEFDQAFIADTVASYDFELKSIRETLADPQARKWSDPESLKQREQKLRALKQEWARQMAGTSWSELEKHISRTNYGDRS
jgi:hypothetical protein